MESCLDLIYWIPIALAIYVIYSSDIIQNGVVRIKIGWKRLSALKSLVGSQHKNIFWVIFYTITTLLKTAWVMFLQKINNNVVKEGRHYIISYVVSGRLYKIKVLAPRGPESITMIIDENSNDVTEGVAPFLRAQRTMIHHFRPSDFKKGNLEIFTEDAAEPYVFTENDQIILPNDEDTLKSLSNPMIDASDPQGGAQEMVQNLMGFAFNLMENMSRPAEQSRGVEDRAGTAVLSAPRRVAPGEETEKID